MKITLRMLKPEDVDALATHANNYNISKNLTNKFPFPYSKKDAKIFIEWALSHHPIQIMAIDVDGELVGSIGIHPLTDIYAKSAELGYWIAESFWGKGIATKAIAEMVRYGFGAFEIDRVFARIMHNNLASQAALKKAGFVFEAKFIATIFKNDQYFDELVYGITKDRMQNK